MQIIETPKFQSLFFKLRPNGFLPDGRGKVLVQRKQATAKPSACPGETKTELGATKTELVHPISVFVPSRDRPAQQRFSTEKYIFNTSSLGGRKYRRNFAPKNATCAPQRHENI